MPSLNSRVNLHLDMPTCIRIGKESEKRGITRTQYIKESIKEKIDKVDATNLGDELISIKAEIKELKTLTITMLEKLRST